MALKTFDLMRSHAVKLLEKLLLNANVSVFFQLGKKCPIEKSENQFFCPRKINFDFNGLYLSTKTGFVAL